MKTIVQIKKTIINPKQKRRMDKRNDGFGEQSETWMEQSYCYETINLIATRIFSVSSTIQIPRLLSSSEPAFRRSYLLSCLRLWRESRRSSMAFRRWSFLETLLTNVLRFRPQQQVLTLKGGFVVVDGGDAIIRDEVDRGKCMNNFVTINRASTENESIPGGVNVVSWVKNEVLFRTKVYKTISKCLQTKDISSLQDKIES